MKTNNKKQMAEKIIVGLLLFAALGALVGAVVVAFKWAAEEVIELSVFCYNYVWEHPGWLPLLIYGTIMLGWAASKTAKRLGNCSGGGIPTAIAAIRGLITFQWMKNLFLVFVSALVTYLGGVPLGNEGPSVQMGTAVGKGFFNQFRTRYLGGKRDFMLVGASAGFAAATCSPITGILFAFEEVRCKWSIRRMCYIIIGVLSALFTSRKLGEFMGISGRLFDFIVKYVMPMDELWSAALVGIACGLFAIVYTRMHGLVSFFVRTELKEMSPTAQKCSVFASVAVIGFLFPEVTGSGHHLVEDLLEGRGIWLLLILCLFLRAAFLIAANNMGVTGGLFVPTLAMGAMIGAICARPLAQIGWVVPEAVPTLIIVGMVSFMAAASHIPYMSIFLAIEAFEGLLYLLPTLVGIGMAYLVVRIAKAEDFSELVIERKAEAERKKKQNA